MIRIGSIVLSLALLVSVGCRRKQQEPPPEQPAAPAAQPAAPAPPPEQPAPQPPAEPARPAPSTIGSGTSAPRAARAPERPRAAPAAPVRQPEYRPTPAAPPPPRPTFAAVQDGTNLEVRLGQALSTRTNHTGDRFEATLDDAVESGGRVVLPRGTTVIGRLTEVEGSGRVSGRAKMSLTLEGIRVRGESYPIRTNTVNLEAAASKGGDAKKIGAGAAIGAIIGAIAGGGKGAAIGAAIGGAAGTTAVVATKGKELELEPEQRMMFRLERDVRVQLDSGDEGGGGGAASASPNEAAIQRRLEAKIKRFEAESAEYGRRGGDPNRVRPLMEEFQRLMQAGRSLEAEKKLDQALEIVTR